MVSCANRHGYTPFNADIDTKYSNTRRPLVQATAAYALQFRISKMTTGWLMHSVWSTKPSVWALCSISTKPGDMRTF